MRNADALLENQSKDKSRSPSNDDFKMTWVGLKLSMSCVLARVLGFRKDIGKLKFA